MNDLIRLLLTIPIVFIAILINFTLLIKISDFEDYSFFTISLILSICTLSNAILYINLYKNNAFLIEENNSRKEDVLKTFLKSIYIFSGIAFILFFIRNIYGILFNSSIVLDGLNIRLDYVTFSDYIYLIIGLLILIDAYRLIILKLKDKKIIK